MTSEENPQELTSQSTPPEPALTQTASLPALPPPAGNGKPARGTTVRRVLLTLLKIIIFLVALVVIVAALLVGWYQLYTQYLRPGQDNIVRVSQLEQSQQAAQQQILTLQAQLPSQAVEQATALAAQSAAQSQRVDTLESANAQQALGWSTAQAQLTALAPRVDGLKSAIDKQTQSLAALQSTQASLLAGDASARAEVKRQVSLVKGMELLSRARLFLFESNFGMARQDIQTARDLLAALPASDDPAFDQSVKEALLHLDMALSRLPDFPVPASYDLDIAWQLLMGGPLPPTVTPTSPAPAPSESTPTPTPTP